MTAIPQTWALRLQLAVIAGNEPAGSYIELRFKRAGGGMAQDFIPVGELERAAASAVNRGQLGDVYLGVCPRTERSGGKDAVARAWVFWCDCDTEQSVERLRAFRPLPSVVIRSGTGRRVHAYWPLRHPVPARFAGTANLRIAHALGADKGGGDRIGRTCCARQGRSTSSTTRRGPSSACD